MSEPPDNPKATEAQRWLAEAQGDLASAKYQACAKELPARIACFLAHLAVEKALKALLVDAGVAMARGVLG